MRSIQRHLVRRHLVAAACLAGCGAGGFANAADSAGLAGIHWWGYYDYGVVDESPADLLNSRAYGGWNTEVVNTHGPAFQQAEFYQPLYNDLYADKNVTIITRVEYEYGRTVPSPGTIDTATWAGDVQGLVNTLKDGGHLWQLGNEPNLRGEGNGWANNEITSAGYADVYRQVRSSLQEAQVGMPGAHKLIVAPVSPGEVVDDRWMSGAEWLGQTLDELSSTTTPVDGIALHSYGGSLTDFRRALAEQLAVVREKGYADVPIYVTEWNRYADPNAADPAAEEAAAAEFARGAFEVVDRWNRTPGNQNIKNLNWFVYDSGDRNNSAEAAWAGYSLKYWETAGNPVGSEGDLYTAYREMVERQFAAGLDGSRPLPEGVSLIEDFESGAGGFDKPYNFSPQTTGLSDGFTVRTADDSHLRSYAQKIGLTDDADSDGWTFRHSSHSGVPGSNEQIELTGEEDGRIGFFLRVLTVNGQQPGEGDPEAIDGLTAQLILDSNGGSGADTDASRPLDIVVDGEWHFYDWSLDDVEDWVPWTDAEGNVIGGSDGVLPENGYVIVDSLWLRGPDGVSVEYFFDTVAHNPNGSLAELMPIPEPGIAGLLGCAGAMLLARRR